MYGGTCVLRSFIGIEERFHGECELLDKEDDNRERLCKLMINAKKLKYDNSLKIELDKRIKGICDAFKHKYGISKDRIDP
jgi:hypothetical protein